MSNVRVEVVEEDDDGLLPIGIAAIVIGAIGALVLVIVLLFFCCFRNRNREDRDRDGCCGGCWGRRRVILLRHKDDAPKMRIVENQAPQPRPIIIKERPCPPQEVKHIYTLPQFAHGQHMRPWMSQEKRQRFVKLNGSLDRYGVTMPRRAIMAAPPPALRAITASENAYTARRDIPTAYLQRGGSLRLTTMQEDMAGNVLSSGGISGGSSVLTPADPEPARYTIVRSSASQPQTPTIQAAQATIPTTMVYQQEQQQQPHPPGFIMTHQQQPDPPGFILTPQMDSYYQDGAAGATYEITGVQNGFLGGGGGSATVNIVPGDATLGQRQSVVLDPYSLVENPSASLVQGDQSLYPRFL